MKKPNYFMSKEGKIPLPVFFPDATRAVIKTLDSQDIKNTKTPGILVNTYHLYRELGSRVLKKYGGIRDFMDWEGGVISDSGGFQVMSLVKRSGKGSVTDKGVVFTHEGKKIMLTPEKSIAFQMKLAPDMVVVLDDFTLNSDSYDKARESVDRTILWAKRSKDEFEKICKERGFTKRNRPLLLGVIQGGEHKDLRKDCAERLVKIGFDGLGFGGWPLDSKGKFNYEIAKLLADLTPEDYHLYGLGIGKPEEIVSLVQMGYDIFDCVLPTRDARHKRLYVYNADSIDKIDIHKNDFYSYYVPDKQKYYSDKNPVSTACDCLLCTNYSRGYLAHLFRIRELSALRLATIHNLRFYSILMERLRT